MVTPGSTPPVWSVTRPIAYAAAALATSSALPRGKTGQSTGHAQRQTGGHLSASEAWPLRSFYADDARRWRSPACRRAAAGGWRACRGDRVRFSSVSVPPWPSAICRLSTRPMPEPPGLVVKNGTNRLPVFCSPGPSSSMRTSSPVVLQRPAQRDAAAGLERRVHGVAHDVDQQLFELIGVGLARSTGGPSAQRHRQPRVERGDAAHQRTERPVCTRCGGGSRARRAYAVVKRPSASARDAMMPSPCAMSSRQSAGSGVAAEQRLEAAGDRLDRRQRVVQLVADDADQPPPRLALLLAQRLAEIRERQQLVRRAALPEARAPHLPAAGAAGEGEVLQRAGRLQRADCSPSASAGRPIRSASARPSRRSP